MLETGALLLYLLLLVHFVVWLLFLEPFTNSQHATSEWSGFAMVAQGSDLAKKCMKPILHYAFGLRFGNVCEHKRKKNARKTQMACVLTNA